MNFNKQMVFIITVNVIFEIGFKLKDPVILEVQEPNFIQKL